MTIGNLHMGLYNLPSFFVPKTVIIVRQPYKTKETKLRNVVGLPPSLLTHKQAHSATYNNVY